MVENNPDKMVHIMMPSPSPSAVDDTDHASEFQLFLLSLAQDPEREQIVSEIEVLQSIYGDNAIRVWHPPIESKFKSKNDGNVRYEVISSLPSPHDDVSIRVLVSLPPTYPSSSPPQLQLLSRYVGAFGADSNLFGSILRTYISVNGVEWSEDMPCVFDGLQSVLERCATWYEERLTAERVGELVREDLKEQTRHSAGEAPSQKVHSLDSENNSRPHDVSVCLPTGVKIYETEPITDRKSMFVGRACRIQHPEEVSIILGHLMSDRQISRAAHPIINAWLCQVDDVLHQDNDDDGETAAGGRLAHLLQILEVNNVLVIVTRYFGGIHLGPDRFKHINQAARNALELGGFLDELTETRKNGGHGRK